MSLFTTNEENKSVEASGLDKSPLFRAYVEKSLKTTDFNSKDDKEKLEKEINQVSVKDRLTDSRLRNVTSNGNYDAYFKMQAI